MNRQWVVGQGRQHLSLQLLQSRSATRCTAWSSIGRTKRPGRSTSATYAGRRTWNDGWQAASGWTQDFTATPSVWTPFASKTLEHLEPPDYFKTEQPVADMMTVEQLWRYVHELSRAGANVVPLQVDLHKKLAFPFVTFVMTLLAVPFGVSTGRRGTLYGIGLGITIALSYWIVISAFVAVGKGGLLPRRSWPAGPRTSWCRQRRSTSS